MRRVAHLLTGLALIGSAAVLAPATALAQDAQVPCDAYARTCPAIPGQPIQGGTPGQPVQGGGGSTVTPPQGGGGTVTQPVQVGDAGQPPAVTGTGGAATETGGAATETGGAGTGTSRTLPFTGADVVLLTLVGAGALAAGAAMVAAGRRRRVATA